MANNRIKIDDTSVDLLKMVTVSLITELSEEKESCQVKSQAFGYWNKDTEEEFQIQVIVTRDESDFIEHFTVEHLKKYNG